MNTFPVSSKPAIRKRETALATIRFVVVLICTGVIGCQESFFSTALPAPIRDEVEYSLGGIIYQVRGGDHFEVKDEHELHYIAVRGVDCPKYGQAFYSQSLHETEELTDGKNVRIEVVGRDELMTEIGDVFVPHENNSAQSEMNIGLELIKRGLGWYDGTEFEDAEMYRHAEEEARAQKIGLWSLEDSVPPAEFESQMNQILRDKLKF